MTLLRKQHTQPTTTCSKLKIETLKHGVKYVKTPERRQWHCFGVLIVNFEHSVVSIVNFVQVNAGWAPAFTKQHIKSATKIYCG